MWPKPAMPMGCNWARMGCLCRWCADCWVRASSSGAPSIARRLLCRPKARGPIFWLWAPIFSTGSHPGAKPAGVDLLAEVARQVKIPFLGIGGINSENVSDVMRAGASGAALISAILSAPDPQEAATHIKERMKVRARHVGAANGS